MPVAFIWERDAGVLAKLMATPTPRFALVTGKAFAAGVRALVQGVIVLVLAAVLGVALTDNPLRLVALMPAWVRAISRVNPLSYEVNALRGLLLDRPAAIGADLAVLVAAAGIGITLAASLLPRLTR
jgi:ABC-2 type transport system permease protein